MSVSFSLRMKKSVRRIFFVCLIFILQLYLPQFIVDANAGQMSMTSIYAGRGDCILMESEGHYMLVDSGVNTETENIVTYLKSLGISKIDYVVSTHPAGDHVGGFARIFEEFEIGETFCSPCSKDLGVFYAFMEALKAEGCPYSNPSYLQSWSFGDATVTCLYDGTMGSTYNECSLVLKVTCDDKSVLLTGDLPSTMEEKLLAMGIDFKCDVLKVGHHGAALSSCADFLDACAPSMAVISSERGNETTLPKPSVLKRLARRFVKTYRTTDGNVKINFVNGEITTDAQENNPYVSLKNASVTLSQNIYTCNGSEQRPDVTVTCNGQVVSPDNYIVDYSDNINSGVGSVKITGNEIKYLSSCSADFLILPKKVAITSTKVSRSNEINIKWRTQAGVSGYTLQYSTDKKFKKHVKTINISAKNSGTVIKKLPYDTKYYIRMRAYTNNVGIGNWSKTVSAKTKKQPKLYSVKFAKKKLNKSKELKLTWKTNKNCDGYFIQYSYDKSFKKDVKTVRASGGKTSTYKKHLKKKKTYYFRIRPYKMGVPAINYGKIIKVRT